MNLRDYLSILRRRKWIGVVVLAAAIATSALMTTLATPLYQARAALRRPPAGPHREPHRRTFLYSASVDIAQRLTKTYAQRRPACPWPSARCATRASRCLRSSSCPGSSRPRSRTRG